jgi:hypothetical protein
MTFLRRYDCILLLLALPGCLSASEWLQLQPGTAEAFIRFDGTYRSADSAGDSNDSDLEAGFRFRRGGFMLDPAIANFYLQLEPYFSQGKSTGAVTEDRDGNFFNYIGRLSLFQEAPGPFAYDFSASRNSGNTDGSLGNRTENDVETRFVQMRWKNRAFPTFLQYEEKMLEQFFRSAFGSGSSDRDEVLKSLSLSGRSSKTTLNLEREWMDDKNLLRNNDYQENRGRLAHRLKWNNASSLRSRIDYTDRTGFNAFRQFNLSETAIINHTDSLTSTSVYRYDSIKRVEESRTKFGEFRLRHRLYTNLATTAHVSDTSIQSDILDEQQEQLGLEFDYRKTSLFGATVNARIGKSYREIDRVSQSGLKDIINESQTVPLAGDVILDERFVITASIIVTDASAIQVFIEGLDYEVFAAGNDLTQLLVIPGGQINVGDTILISYQAENLPTLKFSTTQTDINFRMDWGWVAISHRDNSSDDKRISGAASSFLIDHRYTNTDIQFRWGKDNLDARFGAERRLIRSGVFETTTYTARQSVSFKQSRLLSMDLSISETFSRSDTQDTDLYNLQYSLNWRPSARLSIRPTIGAWKRTDKGITVGPMKRKDSFLSAGFDIRWSFRKLTLDLRYFHNRRGTDTFDTDEDRVMFTLKRRF